MKLRKIVSTILIAAMLFFAPSMIPSMMPARALHHSMRGSQSSAWLIPTDTAFATPAIG